ncbi:MAG: hypothetical protein Ct9H300mP28_21850 [Pseudomonadota bacterium]|nr:MAG: hypothetical protein Ct9H300mP28_21850 [Pseudomonadota bacterium]
MKMEVQSSSRVIPITQASRDLPPRIYSKCCLITPKSYPQSYLFPSHFLVVAADFPVFTLCEGTEKPADSFVLVREKKTKIVISTTVNANIKRQFDFSIYLHYGRVVKVYKTEKKRGAIAVPNGLGFFHPSKHLCNDLILYLIWESSQTNFFVKKSYSITQIQKQIVFSLRKLKAAVIIYSLLSAIPKF